MTLVFFDNSIINDKLKTPRGGRIQSGEVLAEEVTVS